jgi:hypothetical protein
MSLSHASPTPSHAANPYLSGGLATFPSALEQRQQRRARANWAARLIDAAGTINVGRVCDVSEGGFGVISDVHLPVGAMLDIALAVPKTADGERSVPVRCKVRVVSCTFAGVQSRLSVQFLALPKESRIAIRSFVLSHS